MVLEDGSLKMNSARSAIGEIMNHMENSNFIVTVKLKINRKASGESGVHHLCSLFAMRRLLLLWKMRSRLKRNMFHLQSKKTLIPWRSSSVYRISLEVEIDISVNVRKDNG